MVQREIVRKRLTLLSDYLNSIESLRNQGALDTDKIRYAALERFLHLAIESCFDVGEHWVVDSGLGFPESYRDIPTILLEKGKISGELAAQWVAMAGFRNILVHDYVKVDRARVLGFLSSTLSELRLLELKFAELL